MIEGVIKIAVWSNNSFLEESFLGQIDSPEIHFLPLKDITQVSYVLVLVDLSQDLSHISQKIIEIYDQVKKRNQKLTVLILHGEKIDSEKNLYFQELLNKLGGDRPLHRLVYIRDLFQSTHLYSETYLEKYALEAIVERKISISKKGENIFFPVSFADLTGCLQKIFFLHNTAGKNFWVVGDPITDLEIAYLIKKNLEDSEGPEFEIDAGREDKSSDMDLNSLGNQTRALLNWKPQDDFASKLKDAVRRLSDDHNLLMTKLHYAHKQNKHPKLKKINSVIQSLSQMIVVLKTKKGNTKNVETARQFLNKTLEYAIASIVTVYLILTLCFIYFTALSLKSLETTLFDMRKGNIALSVKDLDRSKFYSQIGEYAYSVVSPVISVVAGDVHEKNYNLFIFLKYSQDSLASLQQTYQLAEKIYQTVGGQSTGQFYTDSSLALRSNLSQVYENLNQIELLTNQNKLPLVLQEKINSSPEFKNLKLIEQQISELLKTSELIPVFLAGDSAKNIVILFQNSQEIRSTGGAIDYVLVLVLDQGRLVSKNIYRSDELDSLAAGVVAAPPFVSRFTGQVDWKVRDLNYNPDFPQTATNVSWFIEKTLKFKPDIILAVNDRLIESLLMENKGLLLNGQNITAESFQKELALHSPSAMYQELIGHYIDVLFDHERPLVFLGRVLAKQSEGDQLYFWTSDSDIEKSIIGRSYAGAIYPHVCHGGLSSVANCLPQTTYLNFSNFSFLPLSNILHRKVLHSVWLEPNRVLHEYLVQYQFTENLTNLNRSLNELIQLYAPADSVLDQILLDDKNISLSLATQQRDNNLERFQIPISLSANQPHSLILKFSTSLTKPLLLPFAYSLTEYRQPGLHNQSSELNIKIPDKARPAAITGQVTSGQNNLGLTLPPKTSTFGVSFVLGSQ